MQTDYTEQWTSYSNAAFASMKELAEINAKTIEKLTEEQLDLLSASLDIGLKHLNLVTESKGYKELLSGAAKLVAGYNEKLLESMRKVGDIVTTSKDELSAWFDKGLETTMAPIKKAAVTAKKPTAQAA